MAISRYLSEGNLARMVRDFKFFDSLIKGFKGELDIAIRNNYFNIYYRGNSLARVTFRPKNKYEVAINKGFFENTSAATDGRFSKRTKGDYVYLIVTSKLLHPLLKRKHLNEFASRIKQVKHQEEIVFEQTLIADNRNRQDFIFIDRQVTDGNRNRLDLLALLRQKGNKYRFMAIEVKLGNNSELSEDVAAQLQRYVTHMEEAFGDYRTCYEKNYEQKRQLGLIPAGLPDSIEIIDGVLGLIAVGGYSGQAKEQISNLRKKYQDIKVVLLDYRLDIYNLFNGSRTSC